jgi:hypothetical protein
MPTKSNNTGGRGGRRPGAGRKKRPPSVRNMKTEIRAAGISPCWTSLMSKARKCRPRTTSYPPSSTMAPRWKPVKSIRETWEWLDKIGVAKAVSPQLLGAIRDVLCKMDSV